MSESFKDLVARITVESLEEHCNRLIGAVPCEGDHADCAPDADGWHAFTCVYCGAAV